MKTADGKEIVVGMTCWSVVSERDGGAAIYGPNKITDTNKTGFIIYERNDISDIHCPPQEIYASKSVAVAKLMELINAME